MFTIRNLDCIFPLVLENLHGIIGVADRAVVEAALDAIIGQVLAELDRLPELVVLGLPSADGADTNREEVRELNIGGAELAELLGLRGILGLVARGTPGHVASSTLTARRPFLPGRTSKVTP